MYRYQKVPVQCCLNISVFAKVMILRTGKHPSEILCVFVLVAVTKFYACVYKDITGQKYTIF